MLLGDVHEFYASCSQGLECPWMLGDGGLGSWNQCLQILRDDSLNLHFAAQATLESYFTEELSMEGQIFAARRPPVHSYHGSSYGTGIFF